MQAQLEGWSRQQEQMRGRVLQENGISLPCTRVGGFDISFYRGFSPAVAQSSPSASTESAVACLVVVHFPSMRVEHVDCELVDIAVPYVAGFLGFREVPSYLRLLERCPAAGRPQVLLVDGFGVLHPRRCGSASHLGVLTGVPCVGVGKSLLHVDGLDERTVRAHALLALGRVQPGEASASAQPRDESAATGIGEAVTLSETAVMLPLLSASGGEVLGAALCGQAGSTRPIYISVGAPGHKVTLQTAVALTLACCVHRIPEPIRQADLRSREFIRQQASGAGAGAGAVQV